MSRARLIPSLNYRGKGIVDMSVPNHVLRGFSKIEVHLASNINDAQIAPIKAFEVDYDLTFMSPSVRQLRRQVDENNVEVTRFLFDPNDYATPFVPNTARISRDSEVAFLRLRGVYADGTLSDFGGIVAIPPFDFFATGAPVFTFSGNAPDLVTNGVIPDNLGVGSMNLHLPYYSQTINITNLASPQGPPLFVSFHGGMSPTVLRAGENMTLTSSGAPEMFFSGDGGSPLFTVRASIVNRG